MIAGRLALLGAAAVATIMLMLGLYWKGRIEGAAAERPKTEAAVARAEVARLEVDGARASAARVDVVVRQQSASLEVVRDLAIEATKSEDANVPLAADRVLRLRRADGELCELVPSLDGCGPSH